MDSPPDVFQHTLLLFKDACPPCVYGGMTCTVADCYTIPTQNQILVLLAHKYMVAAAQLHTQIQAHTYTHTHRQTHVSRKCIPLLEGRLPDQLIPACLALFPLCVHVWVSACVSVCVVSINTCRCSYCNILKPRRLSPTPTNTQTDTLFHTTRDLSVSART